MLEEEEEMEEKGGGGGEEGGGGGGGRTFKRILAKVVLTVAKKMHDRFRV
jgi:hypothetical protein